jgi:hypothetical protein
VEPVKSEKTIYRGKLNKELHVEKAGYIPGAVNLLASEAYTKRINTRKGYFYPFLVC